MAATAPVLTTPRLILRPMVAGDFEAFVAMWQEPAVMRFTGPPRSRAECWGSFLRIAGSWVIEGFGQWAVTRAGDGRFLGQVGFFRAMRGHGADFDDLPEAGWTLCTAAHGQGYGAEAARAAHGWLDAQPVARPTVAMIEAGHRVSFRVAAGLGYLPLREVEDKGDRVVLLHREPGGKGAEDCPPT